MRYLHDHAGTLASGPVRRILKNVRLTRAAAVFVVLLVLCVLPADADQLVTRLFTTEDGLARNWVERIRRDSRGRLWFCTVEGLSLFDGQQFTNYTIADGLPHRIVSDILEAGDGWYWLTTGAGLYRFRPAPAGIRQYSNPFP
jgi:ligand-binding sensor domain-containing protein